MAEETEVETNPNNDILAFKSHFVTLKKKEPVPQAMAMELYRLRNSALFQNNEDYESLRQLEALLYKGSDDDLDSFLSADTNKHFLSKFSPNLLKGLDDFTSNPSTWNSYLEQASEKRAAAKDQLTLELNTLNSKVADELTEEERRSKDALEQQKAAMDELEGIPPPIEPQPQEPKPDTPEYRHLEPSKWYFPSGLCGAEFISGAGPALAGMIPGMGFFVIPAMAAGICILPFLTMKFLKDRKEKIEKEKEELQDIRDELERLKNANDELTDLGQQALDELDNLGPQDELTPIGAPQRDIATPGVRSGSQRDTATPGIRSGQQRDIAMAGPRAGLQMDTAISGARPGNQRDVAEAGIRNIDTALAYLNQVVQAQGLEQFAQPLTTDGRSLVDVLALPPSQFAQFMNDNPADAALVINAADQLYNQVQQNTMDMLIGSVINPNEQVAQETFLNALPPDQRADIENMMKEGGNTTLADFFQNNPNGQEIANEYVRNQMIAAGFPSTPIQPGRENEWMKEFNANINNPAVRTRVDVHQDLINTHEMHNTLETVVNNRTIATQARENQTQQQGYSQAHIHTQPHPAIPAGVPPTFASLGGGSTDPKHIPPPGSTISPQVKPAKGSPTVSNLKL